MLYNKNKFLQAIVSSHRKIESKLDFKGLLGEIKEILSIYRERTPKNF